MAAASNSNEEDLISEMLSQQKLEDTANENVSACANCGKEGINLNICTKCKEATYCNAACKKKHKSKHKKQCERRVGELHDEALFSEPPPEHGDCPICFIRLPTMERGQSYMACCGKSICNGCCYADVYDNHGIAIVEKKCPFCRTPDPTSDKEIIQRLKKRMEIGDTYSFFFMGSAYEEGEYGFQLDSAKAVGFYRKAGKHGYTNLGNAYHSGDGVERDEKMASHYLELAAMEGIVMARYNLGIDEENARNYEKALKHYMIAVRGGCTHSVKAVQQLYTKGRVAKDHYANALLSHQAYLNEIKSDQREQAAKFIDRCQYY